MRGGAGARSGSFRQLVTAFLFGVLCTVAGIVAYFYLGKPPVAATEKAAPWEPLLSVPARIRPQAAAEPAPFAASEDVFEAGARAYRAQCVQCHGAPGHDAALGKTMVPRAQQFFSARDGASVTAQQPGAIYWETAFGIRRSGMPAFNHTLTDMQLWRIALLLHSAGDLPDPVRASLTSGLPAPQATVVQP